MPDIFWAGWSVHQGYRICGNWNHGNAKGTVQQTSWHFHNEIKQKQLHVSASDLKYEYVCSSSHIKVGTDGDNKFKQMVMTNGDSQLSQCTRECASGGGVLKNHTGDSHLNFFSDIACLRIGDFWYCRGWWGFFFLHINNYKKKSMLGNNGK